MFDKTTIKLVKRACEACSLRKKGECNPNCVYFELNQYLGGKIDEEERLMSEEVIPTER